MRYELYYWPTIQGRGEFVRLALEDAGADYIDVGNASDAGITEISDFLNGESTHYPPFAPPFLKAGERVVSHVANILQFLGPRLGLVPEGEATRLWAHGLQLTVTDFVAEIHDVHHPISSDDYYETQRDTALARAEAFLESRLPRFLAYFEQVIAQNPGSDDCLVGDGHSYVDLSLFQVVSGLRYAFPQAMEAEMPNHPGIAALVSRVARRERIAAYLRSDRRLPFSEHGIFRHYPELDSPPTR